MNEPIEQGSSLTTLPNAFKSAYVNDILHDLKETTGFSLGEFSDDETKRENLEYTVRVLVIIKGGIMKCILDPLPVLLFKYRIYELKLLTLQWDDRAVFFTRPTLVLYPLLTRIVEQSYMQLIAHLQSHIPPKVPLAQPSCTNMSPNFAMIFRFIITSFYFVDMVECAFANAYDRLLNVPLDIIQSINVKFDFFWRKVRPHLCVNSTISAEVTEEPAEHMLFNEKIHKLPSLVYVNKQVSDPTPDVQEIIPQVDDTNGEDANQKRAIDVLEGIVRDYPFPRNQGFDSRSFVNYMRKRWKSIEREGDWKEYHPLLGVI